MTLKFVEHEHINFAKWDNCILNSNAPFVFAQSFYLNATAPNWDALVIDDYAAVMPLVSNKKLGIKYLFQPPFTSQLGIFGKCTRDTFHLFTQYILHNYSFIDIELNLSNNVFYNSDRTKKTFIIQLKEQQRFNDNTKRNIAKASKAGICIKSIADIEEIHTLIKKYVLPWLKKDIGISAKHCNYFIDLINNSSKKKALKVLCAYSVDGIPLAMACFISNGNHAVYLKGRAFQTKDRSGAMHAIMDHAIQYYTDKAQTFDFGGGNSSGLTTFYKGFGASMVAYNLLKVNKLKWPLNKLKK